MPSALDVYNKTNEALDTLSNVREYMLSIIQDVSVASASSLTVEPDLSKLQKTRKEYEKLLASLNNSIKWLQSNELREEDLEVETSSHNSILEEQKHLQKESERVNSQLKRLLNQSYALQFQIEMFFASSQDVKIT